jgi:hypothetical protein
MRRSRELPVPTFAGNVNVSFPSSRSLNAGRHSRARKFRQRTFVVGRSNKQANDVKAPSDNEADTSGENVNEALFAGASAMTDIDNMMSELLGGRDYLQAEAERVMQANVRYTHLATTASASVRLISESVGKWRDTSSLSVPPSLTVLEAETRSKMNE